MTKALFASLALNFAIAHCALADQATEEDVRREVAIAEFTRKMKEANYPALFEKAAKEFNVPADVLKGVAFAETRWEHLMWPPGETVSPENGMPRPFGIMSLWDNKYFGHSLIEAAQLIGKDPEELKNDPLQNLRGGAALLRKIYDETPRPEGTPEADIESWRYAIRKYGGIPEPDLNAQHALKIYRFINSGYHQYGIEWNARPLNLEPIVEETRRIVAEEKAKRQSSGQTDTNLQARSSPRANANLPLPKAAGRSAGQAGEKTSPAATPGKTRWWWIVFGAATAFIIVLIIFRRQSRKRENHSVETDA